MHIARRKPVSITLRQWPRNACSGLTRRATSGGCGARRRGATNPVTGSPAAKELPHSRRLREISGAGWDDQSTSCSADRAAGACIGRTEALHACLRRGVASSLHGCSAEVTGGLTPHTIFCCWRRCCSSVRQQQGGGAEREEKTLVVFQEGRRGRRRGNPNWFKGRKDRGTDLDLPSRLLPLL